MKFSKQSKPISYLKSHVAEIGSKLIENRELLLITQNDEAKLVVLSVKSCKNKAPEQEETLALLAILALGNCEIGQGKFRDAERIFARLD